MANTYTVDSSLAIGNAIMSVISLLFSLAMFLFILLQKRLRSLSYVILCCIGFSEVFQSLGFFISIIPGSTKTKSLFAMLCVIFSDSWTMLFLSLLSYCTYSLVIKNDREIYKKTQLFIKIGFIAGSIYALCIFLLHFFLISSPNDINWFKRYIKLMDFIQNDKKELTSSIIYYSVNWIMVIFIVVFNIMIKRHMKKRSREDPVNACKIMAICNHLVYYPMFGFLGWAITTVFLIFERTEGVSPLSHLNLMLAYLSGIFICLRGFLISIVFFTSEKIWSIIKLKWKMVSKPLTKINFLQFNPQNTTINYDHSIM